MGKKISNLVLKMFSLSVSDQVRFKTKKGNLFTSLPVYVEFGKLRSEKNSKYVNSSDWNKINAGDWDTRQVRYVLMSAFIV